MEQNINIIKIVITGVHGDTIIEVCKTKTKTKSKPRIMEEYIPISDTAAAAWFLHSLHVLSQFLESVKGSRNWLKYFKIIIFNIHLNICPRNYSKYHSFLRRLGRCSKQNFITINGLETDFTALYLTLPPPISLHPLLVPSMNQINPSKKLKIITFKIAVKQVGSEHFRCIV